MGVRATLLGSVLLVAMAIALHAQQVWHVKMIDDAALSKTDGPETRTRTSDGLPDGLVAARDTGDIRSAWYAMPTKRYGHGILGDAIEAGELKVRTSAGKMLSVQLPETEVFEDRYPRLADLDGDGTTEVITIRSSVTEGASVTVYGLAGGALTERASTGFIGRANRWLNIAGIASFKGGRAKQIAFVRTPHIGGTLYIYEFDAAGLTRAASMYGFSNHVIGSREMRLSATADINNDGAIDLALPSDDRNVLRVMGFMNGTLTELASAPLPSRIDKAIAVEHSSAGAAFIVGLGNGKVYRVGQP
ncbi:MAG: hypothetical protein OER56_12425 [Hyphomicrobiales bacterium]|nr:hypothetical protein [Hyphomicrobiales bacterium]